MFNKVVGGEILIFGDLHFSDVFTGKHKDYLVECTWVLRKMTDIINERKPNAIVLLGDLIGWVETNIKNRQVLSMFCSVLRSWNEICPIYAVRGNHDMKGYPDFQFLSELGLLKTSSMCGGYFDFYGYEGQALPEVRFHMVDYKEEDRHIDLLENTSNVVLAHNNFTISGYTTWYNEHDGIELGMQGNLSGVEMVISGHIHNPSPDMYGATMMDGKTCFLFYPGCPTRVIKDKNLYDNCWYMSIKYDEAMKSTDISPVPFELQPLSEVFYTDEEFVTEKTQEEIDEELRREALKDVLDDLLKYRMNTGDPIAQIDRIPNATDEAKAMASKYLQTAFNMSAG